ncbi:hypothetical protein J6Z48_02365 [bacterium]|nr:hypothetical protein [bacterium]
MNGHGYKLYKFYYNIVDLIELLYSDQDELVIYARFILSRKILAYIYELDCDRMIASTLYGPEEAKLIIDEKTAVIDEYVDLLDTIEIPDWFDEDCVSDETKLLFGAIINDQIQYSDLKLEDIF